MVSLIALTQVISVLSCQVKLKEKNPQYAYKYYIKAHVHTQEEYACTLKFLN